MIDYYRIFGAVSSSFMTWAVAVLVVVEWALIFRKADDEWWKTLIPVYNWYTMFHISNATCMFLPFLLCKLVAGVSAGLAALFVALAVATGKFAVAAIVFGVITLIAIIASLVFKLKAFIELSKKFGKDAGFAIGMLVFPPIFLGILAFGKTRYESNDDLFWI